MSVGGEDGIELKTMRGRDYPSIRQFSIFSPNKMGQMLNLTRLFERARLRICALSIIDSTDCAIIRLVVTRPEQATELLQQHGYNYCEVDLLVVELPNREQPIVAICEALLQAEINIHYVFPLLMSPHGRPALAFYVEDHELGAKVLDSAGFIVLTEDDMN
jgi:hypothetical protein